MAFFFFSADTEIDFVRAAVHNRHGDIQTNVLTCLSHVSTYFVHPFISLSHRRHEVFLQRLNLLLCECEWQKVSIPYLFPHSSGRIKIQNEDEMFNEEKQTFFDTKSFLLCLVQLRLERKAWKAFEFCNWKSFLFCFCLSRGRRDKIFTEQFVYTTSASRSSLQEREEALFEMKRIF